MNEENLKKYDHRSKKNKEQFILNKYRMEICDDPRLTKPIKESLMLSSIFSLSILKIAGKGRSHLLLRESD